MKKKLVICCDGTWATADQVTTKGDPCVTNVVKIAVRTGKGSSRTSTTPIPS